MTSDPDSRDDGGSGEREREVPSERSSQVEHAARGFRVVSLLTLASRVLGLARDVVLARVLGDTALGSAFAAAMAVPNLFRRLFGEGALSAALVPAYAQLREAEKGEGAVPGRADALASLVCAGLALVVGALWLIAELAIVLVMVFAPGDESRRTILLLCAVTLPFMPTICLAAACGGLLQVHHRFGPHAAQAVLLNLAVVVTAVVAHVVLGVQSRTTAIACAAAMSASGVAQLVWTFVALRGHVRWTRRWGDAKEQARDVGRRFVPAALGLGVAQLNTFIDIVLATWPVLVGPTIFGWAYPLDDSANSVLFYAQRLYQFPLGVFGIALATAIFPLLARSVAREGEFRAHVRSGIGVSLFVALPASLGLALVGQDLCAVLLGRAGASAQTGFSSEGVARSAQVLGLYALGLGSFAVNHVLVRSFHARGDTMTPVRVAIVGVVVNLVLNLVLMWPMREAGLAMATVVSALVQSGLLTRQLHGQLHGGLFERADVLRAHNLLFPLLGVGVGVIVAWLVVPAGTSWTLACARVVAAVVLASAGYIVLATLTRSPGLDWVLRSVRRAGR